MSKSPSTKERLKRIAQRQKLQRDIVLQQFSDRDGLIAVLEELLSKPKGTPVPALMLYGVGGIGKTWFILYAIEAICKKRGIPFAYQDFREEIFRSPVSVLRNLRREIAKDYKYKFKRFELVWALYLKQTLGYSSTKEGFIREEFEDLGDILDELELLPFASELVKTIKLIELLGRKTVDWFRGHFGEDWGHVLETMGPPELVATLPILFAEDLNDNVNQRNTRFVLFLDTFEVIEDSESPFVRELAATLDNVLLVIGGRNRLNWEKQESVWASETNLTQYLVGNFSEQDTKKYLTQFDITDESIVNLLIRVTQGHPQYLALAVDLIKVLLRQNRQITLEILQLKGKDDLLPRLLEELSADESDFLTIAAVPRWFNEEVLEQLSSNPASVERLLNSLVQYSFVEPNVGVRESYRLHAVIRGLLLTRVQGKSFVLGLHKKLADYFNSLIEADDKENKLAYVSEQLYHEFHFEESTGFDHFQLLFEQALGLRNLDVCRTLLLSLPEKELPLEIRSWIVKWQADLLRMEYRNEEAMRLYESLLAQAENNYALQAHGLRGLGAILRRVGPIDLGETYYHQALEAARKSGERIVEIDLLRRVGSLQRERGREQEAKELLQTALDNAKVVGDEHSKALVLNDLGRWAAKFGYWETAREYYMEAVSSWEETGNEIRATSPLQNWGVIEIRFGDLSTAEEKFKKHLWLGWRQRLWGQIEIALHNLGAIAYDYGLYDAAIAYRSQRLAIRETRGGDYRRAWAMYGLASCLIQQGNWEEAENLLLETLQIYQKERPNSSNISAVNRRMARLYTLRGEFDLALRHAEVGLQIAEDRGSKVAQIRSHREKGDVHYASGEYELARKDYEVASEMVQGLQARLLEQELSIRMGKVYLQQGEWNAAKESIGQGLNLARSFGTRYEEVEALIELGLAYYYESNLRTAYECLAKAEARAKVEPFTNVSVVWDQGPLAEIEEHPIKATPYFERLSYICQTRAAWRLKTQNIRSASTLFIKALDYGYRYNSLIGQRRLGEIIDTCSSLSHGKARRLLITLLRDANSDVRQSIPQETWNAVHECLLSIVNK